MERLAVSSLTASFDSTYFSSLSSVVTHITSKGKYAVLDPHNYGRYKNAIITDVIGFGTFWKNLATPFKSNANVVSRTLDIFISPVKYFSNCTIT